MSSICGAISISGKPILESQAAVMVHNLSNHPFDTQKVILNSNQFMVCNLLQLTEESKEEILPFCDSISNIMITCDCILDNRNELGILLNIPLKELNNTPDSQIILSAYKKWGRDCVSYLKGDFAFVIWDESLQELYCCRDHVGKRTLYYYIDQFTFVFSTLMKPILAFMDHKIALNEQWIADFLSIEGVIHEYENEHTVYSGVFQVPPATYLVFNRNGLTKVNYWNPIHTKEISYKSNKEYEEGFLEVFTKAVQSKIRTNGNVGIMLSGGLDSSSVASISAKLLAEQNQKLYGYHSIPMDKFKNWLPKTWIANEQDYIIELQKMYPNIHVKYLQCNGKSPYSDIKKYLNIYEQPYKHIENSYWIHEVISTASQDRCKVLLDGQYGNFTISYGNYLTQLHEYYNNNNWISLYREIHGFSKLHSINKFVVAKKVIRTLLVNRKQMENSNNDSIGKNSPIHPALAAKWNTIERARKYHGFSSSDNILSFQDARKLMCNFNYFSHISSIETKVCLANGIVKRDPTRDKDVIEFLLGVPANQFVQKGKDRYLLRRAMDGILPEKIRSNYSVRGKQVADWTQRVSLQWDEIKCEFQKLFQDNKIERYLDIPMLKETLLLIGEDIENDPRGLNLRMLLISLVFYYYLQDIGI